MSNCAPVWACNVHPVSVAAGGPAGEFTQLPGKTGNVREFSSGLGNVGELTKTRRNVGEEILSWKLIVAYFMF